MFSISSGTKLRFSAQSGVVLLFRSYVDHFYVCQRSDGMYCGVYADIDNRFLWVFVKELFFSVERPPSRLTNVALEALRIDQQTSDMIAYIM